MAVAGVLGSSLMTGCADPQEALELTTIRAPLVTADASAKIDGRYIVVFKDSVAGRQAIAAAMSRVKLTSAASHIEHQYSIIAGFSARLDPGDLDAVRRNPEVAYVEQDQRMFAMASRIAGGDLELDRHDHCPALDDSTFNDNGCAGNGVLIYVVDSGIRAAHSEFRPGRVLTARGFTAISDNSGTSDCNGHGTYIASLAAGRTFGMANTASLVPVRVLDCLGAGSTSGVVAGVDFVRSNCGASERCVATMSLGGAASTTLDSAVTALVAAGVPFAAAAGNSNSDARNFSPGRTPAALTVGCASDTGYPATDASRTIPRCPSSNFGPAVDMWASGSTVLGADDASDTATQTLTGTSGPAAYVAGAVAQLLSCSTTEPSIAQIEAILDGKAISDGMSDTLALGGAQNLFLCSDFSNDGVDACACPSPPPPPPPPAPDSCIDNNLCTGQAPAGCFCDVACIQFGDCCPDGPCTS